MANLNRFQGLARGPIDHKSSSVINQISNVAIDMGSVVSVADGIFPGENLPRVEQKSEIDNLLVYGIAVGGDADGVYGDGSPSTDDSTRAATGAGQGVVIVTQGRCLARVSGSGGKVLIGLGLTTSIIPGELILASTNEHVIAIALHDVETTDTDMIAVDVQRSIG